jgi:hypothetical protein
VTIRNPQGEGTRGIGGAKALTSEHLQVTEEVGKYLRQCKYNYKLTPAGSAEKEFVSLKSNYH